MAALHTDWEIIASTFDIGGTNSQIVRWSENNLTRVDDVDATRLSEGSFTAVRRYNDIVFNGPRGRGNAWIPETTQMLDLIFQDALRVLKPGGALRFSSTDAGPSGKFLNQVVLEENRSSEYTNSYKRPYEADRRFGIPYVRRDNKRMELYGYPAFWFAFQKGG